MASLLEEVDGLQLLTEDLLVLTPGSTLGPRHSAGRPVDLDDVVLEAARGRNATSRTRRS